MSVAKVTEIIASSPKSFDDAIKTGVARAHKTLKNSQVCVGRESAGRTGR